MMSLHDMRNTYVWLIIFMGMLLCFCCWNQLQYSFLFSRKDFALTLFSFEFRSVGR